MYRKPLLLSLFLLLPACSTSPAGAQSDDEPLAPTTNCRGFQYDSPLASAPISVEIALPEGYQESSGSGYGTIYLLDANYFFDDQPGTLDDLLERGEGMTKIVGRLTAAGTIPPAVLVGIGYSEEDRSRLTLSDVEAFLAFFTQELIPAVESRCHVKASPAQRLLFGYSASAHFSTYVLLHDAFTGSETFHDFISISGFYQETGPARRMEERVFQEKGSAALAGRRLFMAVGEADPKVDLLNAHRAFTGRLVGRGYTGLTLSTSEIPGRGHYDIPEVAFEQGLIWIYSN